MDIVKKRKGTPTDAFFYWNRIVKDMLLQTRFEHRHAAPQRTPGEVHV
ncbi:hypothetical protein [Brevibacillus laterosporus]|nr:hypothetical protein [Brevibacillus laterosporus]